MRLAVMVPATVVCIAAAGCAISGNSRDQVPEGGGPQILAGPGVNLAWVIYADADRAIAGWDLCSTNPRSAGPCDHMRTQTDDGWVSSSTRSSDATALLTSDGRIAWWSGPRGLIVMDSLGDARRLRGDRTPTPAPSGSPLVGSSWSTADLWWIDDEAQTAYPVPGSPHITARFSAVRSPGGRLWVQGWGADTSPWLAWSDDGGATWTEHRMQRHGYPGGLTLGRDGQIAAFGYVAPGSDHVVSRSIISRDNGRTWQPFAREHGPRWVGCEGTIGGPSAVTTLPDGTLFVSETVGAAGGRHQLWTATGDWSDLHPLKRIGGGSGILSNGDVIWAGHGPKNVLVSTDAGRTWHIVSPR